MNQTAWDKIFDPALAMVQLLWQLDEQRYRGGSTDYRTRKDTLEATLAGIDSGTARKAMGDAGLTLFEDAVGGHLGLRSRILGWFRTSWVAHAYERMLVDAPTNVPASTSAEDVYDALLVEAAETTAQTVDAAEPTVSGTPVYGTKNQGDGTVTIAVPSDTTQRENALGGTWTLTNQDGGYANQLTSTWRSTLRPTDPDSDEPVRQGANVFTSGKAVADVLRNEANREAATLSDTSDYTSGLDVEVLLPGINSVNESGDSNNAISNYDFARKAGHANKSPWNRWNTTFAYAAGDASGGNGNGTIYLRFTDLTGSWSVIAYQDSGLSIPLTESRTFTEGGGDETDWELTVASTHPSAIGTSAAIPDPNPFLTAGTDPLMSFNIDDSALTLNGASFTITVNVNLPWAKGDTAGETITRSTTAGKVGRVLKESFGAPFPAATGAAETVSDPAA